MKLGTDREKERELRTSTQHVCHCLNNSIIPICRELHFSFDVSDIAKLNAYLRNTNTLKTDYLASTIVGATNPTMIALLRKQGEELWNSVRAKHPINNPTIIDAIVPDVFDYILISGCNVLSFNAKPNNKAIEQAVTIEADSEDLAKIEELKRVCDSLNKCFNGSANLFWSYFALDRGLFALRGNITNYKPLIYGE